ncbi:LPS assembly protein LptD [Alphaproteobacteria bacterium]|nr:LPS assembly protein LptD [Alphaproteobacteria bacterium]
MGFLFINCRLRCLLFLLALSTPTNFAFAADKPIGFEADNVVVNQADGSLFATGNVELKQANNTLRADEVTYYRNQNKAIARGNVVHIDGDGTVTNAAIMEIDNEFSHILAETIISNFTTGEWISANHADRIAGDRGIFDASRFTPCKCDFLNGERPLWDIKASQTVRNEKTQTITHYNMRMNVLNVPIGYLPFLSHPDWAVRRRSGFLTPRATLSAEKGLTTIIPYYRIIDQTSDATFNANIYQRLGYSLRTDYRKLWDKADLNASVITANVETYKEPREFVGAVDAAYSSQIGNGWNVSARLKRTSQDTFLRRYNFNPNTSLKSNITASRIVDNRYYHVEVSDRQSLLASNKTLDETTVLPSIFYEKVEKGWRKNQSLRKELSAIQLDNDQGHDMARWSGVLEVAEDFHLPLGIANYKANITGDYYSIHTKPNDVDAVIGDHAFATPALSVGWQIPITVKSESRRAVIEPLARLAYVGGNDRASKIPNRDAGDYRIDEANLFLLNRYQGKDYALPGTRLDLGISVVTTDNLLGEASGFIGFSKTLHGDLSPGTSLEPNNKRSDYVSSLSISPLSGQKIRWTGRISSSDQTLLESRASITTNLGSGSLSLSHNQLDRRYFNGSYDAEELSTSYSDTLTGIGTFSVGQVWDLTLGKTNPTLSSASISSGEWTFHGSQSWGELNNKLIGKKMTAGLSWNGGPQDCLYFSINYEKDPSVDRDIKSREQISFLLTLKHIGSFGSQTIQSLMPTDS